MKAGRLAAFLLLTGVATASAQTYQSPPRFEFFLDAFARQEWDRDVYEGYSEMSPPGYPSDPYGVGYDDPYAPGTNPLWGNTDRFRVRALPRLRVNLPHTTVVVGGDFGWTSKNNVDPAPRTLDDNFRARDARVDLAYVDVRPTGWLRLQAGRIPMPVRYSEMIWDHDLRAQGGAVTISPVRAGAVLESLEIVGLYAKGSHVFEDESEMLAGAVAATFSTGDLGSVSLTASYTTWRDLETLESFLWRQNRRAWPDGPPAGPFDVVDAVLRFHYLGTVPFSLLADVGVNTAVDDENLGLWLGANAGGFGSGRWAAEYTYAWVDRDATVAAFAADDYLWETGWEGHRAQLDFKLLEWPRSASASTVGARAVGVLTRYKDSPVDAQRDHWSRRLRLELVLAY